MCFLLLPRNLKMHLVDNFLIPTSSMIYDTNNTYVWNVQNVLAEFEKNDSYTNFYYLFSKLSVATVADTTTVTITATTPEIQMSGLYEITTADFIFLYEPMKLGLYDCIISKFNLNHTDSITRFCYSGRLKIEKVFVSVAFVFINDFLNLFVSSGSQMIRIKYKAVHFTML